MVWAAQSLQFVLFSAPKAGLPDALQPWLKLFQSSPQSYQQAPPGAPQFQSSASAIVGDYYVTVGAMSGRLDLILSHPPSVTDMEAPQLIADVRAGLSVLVEYAKRILDSEAAQRLAIVVNLIEHVPNPAAAVQKFVELTGGLNVPPGGTDLALQLNVPKQNVVTGRSINRLCKWQTQLLQMFTIQMDASGATNPLVNTSHAVGLMVDINTVPSAVNFERSIALDLVVALADEASQIISRGYEYVAG